MLIYSIKRLFLENEINNSAKVIIFFFLLLMDEQVTRGHVSLNYGACYSEHYYVCRITVSSSTGTCIKGVLLFATCVFVHFQLRLETPSSKQVSTA